MELQVENWLIFGIPAIALIIAIVELAKHYGMDSRWAPLLSIGMGILFAIIGQLAQMYPIVEMWYSRIILGIVGGLMASGIYSGQKALRGK